jgi:hypothetical protein
VTRFAILTLGAVIVATAILAVLGYVSLRQWEAAAELLFREQARDMATMAAENVEMAILKGEADALSGLQVLVLDSDLGPDTIEHPGEVLTRDRLLDEVWGYDRFPTTRTVDTHILRLRQKFEGDPEHPRHIVTAHGQGYRFEA